MNNAIDLSCTSAPTTVYRKEKDLDMDHLTQVYTCSGDLIKLDYYDVVLHHDMDWMACTCASSEWILGDGTFEGLIQEIVQHQHDMGKTRILIQIDALLECNAADIEYLHDHYQQIYSYDGYTSYEHVTNI